MDKRIEELVALHKLALMQSPGTACQALIQTLGHSLHTGAMTAEDVAKVISGVWDENRSREIEAVTPAEAILCIASLLGL